MSDLSKTNSLLHRVLLFSEFRLSRIFKSAKPSVGFHKKPTLGQILSLSSVRPYIAWVIKSFETLRPARLQSLTSVRTVASPPTGECPGADVLERIFTDATERQLGILVPSYLGKRGFFAAKTPIPRYTRPRLWQSNSFF